MSPSPSFERQCGFTLIEALVGMLLAGLIAACSVYAVARASRTQHAANLRSSVVEQVRAQVMASGAGLCGNTASVKVGPSTLSAVYTCTPYAAVVMSFPGFTNAVTVDATAAAARAQIITVSVSSPSLGGTLTVSTQ